MALTNPVPSDYPALFRNYLKRATRSALQPTPQDTFPQTGGYERTSQLIHTLTYALQSPEMWGEARALLFSLGETLERTARHDDLISLLEAGIVQSLAVGDYHTHALLQIRLSRWILSRAQSDRAYSLLNTAYAYFAENNAPLHQGQALVGLIRWASQRGDIATAAAYADEALATLPTTAYDDRAVVYSLIGGNAFDRQNWDAAFRAYQESLQLWQLGGNSRFIGFGWANLGSALRGLARYEEAIAAFQEGIQRFEAVQDLVNRASVQVKLGNLYSLRLQYHEAIEQFHAAETVFRHLNLINELARLYNNWGMAYAGLEWGEQAVRAYEQSIDYWETLQNGYLKANTLDNLGLVLFGMGRYAASADAYRRGLAELERMPGRRDRTLYDMLTEHLAEARSRL